ncbi:MAG: hypothetical protein M0R38_06220 [Bacteroidia bacterium]|nr:hypothetical protein [Bacteroidia bacterium]
MKQRFNIIFALFAFSLSIFVFGCKQKNKGSAPATSGNEQSAYEFEKALYQHAYNIGDHMTAIIALNRMLVMDSTQTQYYDSLSRHYIALGNSNSAAYYAEKALALDPGDVRMLEIAGFIYFDAGDFKKAEEKINKLYQITKEPKYLYSLSQVYAYMGDIKKSNEMTDLILKDGAIDNLYVDVSTSTGQVQSVRIKAAAYFVKANLVQNPKTVVSLLGKALAIQPDFEVAKKIKEEMEVQNKMQEIQNNEDILNKYKKK